MRAALTAVGVLVVVGCGRAEPAPAVPQAKTRGAHTEAELPAPSKPTPAFVPAEHGRCERAYRLLEGTCVHRHYQVADESALSAALAEYKRGAAPPMLAARAEPVVNEAATTEKPGPGSLMRQKQAEQTAETAKQRRLAELDAMLALAREKLAKRDAESRAKQVANGPRKGRDGVTDTAGDRESLDQFARSVGAGGARGADTATGSPEARMDELSRLTSQLSPDQLKTLGEELGKSGINPAHVDALMREAQTTPDMR